jgi:hypothetical protein
MIKSEMDNLTRKELIKVTYDVFKTISDCLSLYYKGRPHMFKPIAAQLRILYCDSNRGSENSLLHHLDRKMKLLAFRQNEYTTSHPHLVVTAYDRAGKEIPNAIKMKESCFRIIEDKNGIAYPDIDLANPPVYLSLAQWRDQIIDDNMQLTVKDIIRTIADKGGGAHVDMKGNTNLKLMKKRTPANIDYQLLFIIALARYTIRLAKNMVADWGREFPGLTK